MRNAVVLERGEDEDAPVNGNAPSIPDLSGVVVPFQSKTVQAERSQFRNCRQLVSTKELSEIWGVPESTLRYWRSAEIGPPYVKLGGRIKYDLADVERYVRANKRMPSVRAHGG